MANNMVKTLHPIQSPLSPLPTLSRANSSSSQSSTSAASSNSNFSAVTAATTLVTPGVETPPKTAAEHKADSALPSLKFELSLEQVKTLAEALKARAHQNGLNGQTKVQGSVLAATPTVAPGVDTPPKTAAQNQGFTLPNRPKFELSPEQVKTLAEALKARAKQGKPTAQAKVMRFVLLAASGVAQGLKGFANKLGAKLGAGKQYVSALFAKKTGGVQTVAKSPTQQALAEMELEAEMNSWHQS